MIDHIASNCGGDDPTGALAAACDALPVDALRAVDVLGTYYAAINAGDYARAYRQWGEGGVRSGKTLTAFSAGFAQTRVSHLRVQSIGDSEGAAGSIFITIPVQVDATLKSGATQRFAGNYVLRRVNNVPGATAEQLHWHIDSAALRVIR